MSVVPLLQFMPFILKKSLFLSVDRAKRTLSWAHKNVEEMFQKRLLRHCRAAHDSTAHTVLQFRWWFIFAILKCEVQ